MESRGLPSASGGGGLLPQHFEAASQASGGAGLDRQGEDALKGAWEAQVQLFLASQT